MNNRLRRYSVDRSRVFKFYSMDFGSKGIKWKVKVYYLTWYENVIQTIIFSTLKMAINKILFKNFFTYKICSSLNNTSFAMFYLEIGQLIEPYWICIQEESSLALSLIWTRQKNRFWRNLQAVWIIDRFWCIWYQK